MASPEKPCLLLIVIRAGGHEAVGKAATDGRSLSITVNGASLGPEKVRRCAWGRRVKRSRLCGFVRRLSGRECTALAEDCSLFPSTHGDYQQSPTVAPGRSNTSGLWRRLHTHVPAPPTHPSPPHTQRHNLKIHILKFEIFRLTIKKKLMKWIPERPETCI